MSVLLKSCTVAMALLLAATAASAQTATPPAGEYIYEGGAGTLTVKAGGRFDISTVGANAHSCTLDGTIVQGKAKMADSPCVVTFAPSATQVVVGTNGSDRCRDACGARAGFEGNYIKPSAACTTKAVAATRKTFKRQYDAKDYATALATLAPVLTDCDTTLDWIDKGRIRNDLALVQLRAGDRAACRNTLQPLAEDAGKTDSAIREDYPPADADLYLGVLRAARTNLKLCKG
ncbi:MAG: hypothetical protein EOO26_04490 [Comamonadaceae bacterium]|nr:MAG: hypothetical protein EOO26_04490 [Comamonadaceae bacterium]